MCIETALAKINAPFTGELPIEAIRVIQAHPAESTPRLIEIIRQATARVQAGEKLPGNGQLIAAFLLAEFQATEALPTLVEAISLPEDGADELFGDMITEDLCRMLAVLDADNLEASDSLIANLEIFEYVRRAAIHGYFMRARDGRMSRSELLRRLGRHLLVVLRAKDEEGISAFDDYFKCFAETVFFNELIKAHELAAEHETALDQALAQAMSEKSDAEFKNDIAGSKPTRIEDTVKELSKWACYSSRKDRDDRPEFKAQWEEAKQQVLGRIDPPEPPLPPPGEPIRYEGPRTGRNDPCPCGSGKKYKKCCARA